MKLNQRWIVAASLATLGGLVACGGTGTEEIVGTEETAAAVEPYEPEAVVPTKAHAVLTAAEGLPVEATVSFSEEAGGVRVSAWVRGAEPGPHGFHLHEVGDCSSPDFKSSGGHFNPEAVDHAGPDSPVRHAGDWGNLVVGEDGEGQLELTTDLLMVGEGDHSVVGRAVVLHGGTDDLVSQPSGAAGPRIACGVVAVGEAPMGDEEMAPAASEGASEATDDTEDGEEPGH